MKFWHLWVVNEQARLLGTPEYILTQYLGTWHFFILPFQLTVSGLYGVPAAELVTQENRRELLKHRQEMEDNSVKGLFGNSAI